MKRTPAGAAVLQPQVTAAIREAAFAELAEVGYGKLSMEAVARRAGVSKPTLYRRWPSKQQLVLALVSEVAVTAAETPDTGSLRGDLRAYLEATAAGLAHPLAARIIPDLLAEAVRTPELARALQTGLGEQRRARVAELLRRGIDRGELPVDLNIELALDFTIGPLFWRQTLRGDATDPDYLDELAEMVLRALRARPDHA
ncbi:TetR/AcrR family transcriptional regulator [Nocardia sp. CDC159]|uniref:TetR/AcrR family transcriptional regulator n=1 Tax=Nocardia pulmonis TaxID=2951408 RepID=A0A9X2E5H5_9NOCA|nr:MULTISPECIES: TetR/AcrR family transcriptional regulator [Nocardia]MCM6773448.1 TetR/AcrR family transcriptional regulator [Nocardia pulmonis]MCM6786335.1 TetR/AcrR family transcriptional regulator [Nocardia sp. CDC159]